MAIEPAENSVNGWNAQYIDTMYERWSARAESVEPQWRQFFAGFELGTRQITDAEEPAEQVAGVDLAQTKQGHVDDLIYAYRDTGHLAAALDPLGTERPAPASLKLQSYELSETDLAESFDPCDLPLKNPANLRDIVELLEQTYCRHIGVEFMHMQDSEQRRWLAHRMETVRNRPPMNHDQKMHILGELGEADAFETFLHTRYTAKKRFGLDGSESLIPLLDELIEQGPVNDVREF